MGHGKFGFLHRHSATGTVYHCACDRADPDPRAARRRGPGHDPGGNLHQRGDVKLRAQADYRCSHAGAVRRIDHAADRRFHARDIRTDTGTAAMIAPGLAGVEAQLWLWLIAMIRPGAAFFAAPVFGTRAVDRKSTRLTPVTNAKLVCRILLEKTKSLKH